MTEGSDSSLFNGLPLRLRRFLQKPWSEKAQSLKNRWSHVISSVPVPTRLPFGVWWIPAADYCGKEIREGRFENSEFAFVSRFLRPGMTVLDLGAHHGFYTLLASTRVGPRGRVFAFEPSPRETKALLRHVRINRCGNVKTESLALGSEETEAALFVVQGAQTGCNSLRAPAADVPGALDQIRVHVVRLDDWLSAQKVSQVDFAKIDVEGAELEVLKGAQRLLHNRPRPVLLIEVQDSRTQPWGYSAHEIILFLANEGFKWLDLSPDGTCAALDIMHNRFEGNYVACPSEREQELRQFLSPT